jgi:hypothetical protein
VDTDAIKRRVRDNRYLYSQHADIERRADGLMFAQIEEALLNCEILERYPDTGRGESCLALGFAGTLPIHVVCGWKGDAIVIITVYVPRPPRFSDPRTRGGHDED